MRIGKFAKTHNISIDTVRHYMNIKLIIPEKRAGQYYFDHKCNDDIKDIIYLKDLGFTLHEIKEIFQYKRLGRLSSLHNNQYYKRLFVEKYDEIEEKMKKFETSKQKLKDEITKLNMVEVHHHKQIGVPFSALSLFECKKCSTQLSISDGDIQHHQIINGTLHCACNENYLIKDGILFTSDTVEDANRLLTQDQNIDTFSHFLMDYIKETDEEFIDSMFKNIDLAFKKLEIDKLDHKTMMHLGTGFGFSLRQVYDSIPQKTLYIAVDHNYERHQVLKSILETYDNKKNILFICSDFLNIPIKNQAIDYLIDTGTSNYSAYHKSFLLKEIQHYLKSKSYLIGSYMYYSNFHVQHKMIEEPYRKNFQLEYIKKKIDNLNYNPIYTKTFLYSNKSPGKYELEILEGENVFHYTYIGKRLG
ncbi:MerR family transcriptional regulator [Chengkuizengella axinellae]|uniref:MerR family transcriptional regulator n=1 Tax=Chengkuizengella axinellae TaxID=3064388 RepID=A0ABT9J4L4_9BACL|nr:MerR family transcriptional regulator [Chengkuizengella sp. 2205SS18-9]MDP5276534.1 MerR family transcriptional regulator [Chengkuizengella sp. 2205SS18-9]